MIRVADQLGTGMSRDVGQFGTGMIHDIGQFGTGMIRDVGQFGTGMTRDIGQFGTGMIRVADQSGTGMIHTPRLQHRPLTPDRLGRHRDRPRRRPHRPSPNGGLRHHPAVIRVDRPILPRLAMHLATPLATPLPTPADSGPALHVCSAVLCLPAQSCNLRTSRVEPRKFYLHNKSANLQLRAESREDRRAWLQAIVQGKVGQTGQGSYRAHTHTPQS